MLVSNLSPFTFSSEDDSDFTAEGKIRNKRKMSPSSLHNLSVSGDTLTSYSDDIFDEVSQNEIVKARYPFQKPKRTRFSRNRPLPRLFRNDVRQHYAAMLMNALNSHDFAYIR